jgi:hypothetical protein
MLLASDHFAGSSIKTSPDAGIQRRGKRTKWKAEDTSLAESAHSTPSSRQEDHTSWFGIKTGGHPSPIARFLYRNVIKPTVRSLADGTEKAKDREKIQRFKTDGNFDKQPVRILERFL